MLSLVNEIQKLDTEIKVAQITKNATIDYVMNKSK